MAKRNKSKKSGSKLETYTTGSCGMDYGKPKTDSYHSGVSAPKGKKPGGKKTPQKLATTY